RSEAGARGEAHGGRERYTIRPRAGSRADCRVRRPAVRRGRARLRAMSRPSPRSLMTAVMLAGAVTAGAPAPAPAAAPKPAPAKSAPAHDVDFWRDIKAHDAAMPEGAAPGALLLE